MYHNPLLFTWHMSGCSAVLSAALSFLVLPSRPSLRQHCHLSVTLEARLHQVGIAAVGRSKGRLSTVTGQQLSVSRLSGQLQLPVSRLSGQLQPVSRLSGQQLPVSRLSGQLQPVSRLSVVLLSGGRLSRGLMSVDRLLTEAVVRLFLLSGAVLLVSGQHVSAAQMSAERVSVVRLPVEGMSAARRLAEPLSVVRWSVAHLSVVRLSAARLPVALLAASRLSIAGFLSDAQLSVTRLSAGQLLTRLERRPGCRLRTVIGRLMNQHVLVQLVLPDAAFAALSADEGLLLLVRVPVALQVGEVRELLVAGDTAVAFRVRAVVLLAGDLGPVSP